MMKRITGILLVVFIVLGMAASVTAAPTVPGAVYSDMQGVGSRKPPVQIQEELQQAGIQDVKADQWYAGSVTVIVQAGLLQPSADGKFHPEAQLNTGDGVAVFAKVLGLAAKSDTPEQALQKAKDAGIVSSGATEDKNMTRMDTARLLAAALGVEPKAVTSPAEYPFNDFDSASPEDRGLLKALYDLGIFKGYPEDGKILFKPDNILTRAEISILIDRILGAH